MTKEIKTVHVQVRAPKGRDPGKVELGHYYLEGDVVHLVTIEGKPRLSRTFRKPITRKLSGGENEREAAYRLTRENLPDRGSNFNRPLHYPNRGKI